MNTNTINMNTNNMNTDNTNTNNTNNINRNNNDIIRELILDHLILPAGQPSHDRSFDLESKMRPLSKGDPQLIKMILDSTLDNFQKSNLFILYIEAIVANQMGEGDRLIQVTETIKLLNVSETWYDTFNYVYNNIIDAVYRY
jgi:hypothetical protein